VAGDVVDRRPALGARSVARRRLHAGLAGQSTSPTPAPWADAAPSLSTAAPP
jgi:hypothetical protein